uniref:Uncharacterized protein n=1 Tax=Anguilla anguilla TaxID=7936 RepID=A0A0E9SN68_ANGAN
MVGPNPRNALWSASLALGASYRTVWCPLHRGIILCDLLPFRKTTAGWTV